MLQLNAENAAASDIVAIAEPAGDAENLEVGEQFRRFQQLAYVHVLRAAAGALKGKRGFHVAIGARRSENEDSRLHRSILCNAHHFSGFCQADFNWSMSISIRCRSSTGSRSHGQQLRSFGHFAHGGMRNIAHRFFEMLDAIGRHLDEEPAVRFGKQQRGWQSAGQFGCLAGIDRVRHFQQKQPRAQSAGKRHLGRGDGQPAFAQIVARPHQSGVNRLVQRRERRFRRGGIDLRHVAAVQVRSPARSASRPVRPSSRRPDRAGCRRASDPSSRSG